MDSLNTKANDRVRHLLNRRAAPTFLVDLEARSHFVPPVFERFDYFTPRLAMLLASIETPCGLSCHASTSA
jgi:hypothetical protein